MKISVVIPLLNEAASLPTLCAWLLKALDTQDFEIIFVDDGSTDDSWKVIQQLAKHHRIKGIRLSKNYGKSAALFLGFEAASADIIITMDADLQDSPDEILPLVAKLEEGYDVVSGWKKKRYDPLSKTLPTKLFNFAARAFSGINLHDFNCGLKAYRKEVIKNIEVYGEMHRYLPWLAKNAGFTRITEKEVQHSPRKHGTSKFGWSRFINGFLDLFSLLFMARFAKKPMHFFGFLGTLLFIISFSLMSYLLIDKLFFTPTAKLVSQRTEFLLSITGLIIGTQFFLAGFLAELISRNAQERNVYRVRERV